MHACFKLTPLPTTPWRGCAPRGSVHRAVSLLETTVALSILGIGLIMIAAVFPVALSQHRESADQARALEVVSKAEAILHNRLDASRLWFDDTFLINGRDSYWYLVPFANILAYGTYDFTDAVRYADAINNAPLDFSTLQLFGTDVLSDRIAPINDAQAQEAPNRLVWYGFYRQLANGTKSYSAAVCKQRRKQIFYKQDLTITLPTLNPTPVTNRPLRFPVPWRVTVARFSNPQFANAIYIPGPTSVLTELAPPGTKIMIHGHTCADALPFPSVPAGRILTVANPIEDGSGVVGVQILEDIRDIPPNDPADATDNNFGFDIWLFPPATNARVSPVLEWKVSL